MSSYIIRKIPIVHCARGPENCKKCKEIYTEKICLLDISPPHYGEWTRRVIEVEIDGEKVCREFDVVKIFQSEDEAREYAEKNEIKDVKF